MIENIALRRSYLLNIYSILLFANKSTGYFCVEGTKDGPERASVYRTPLWLSVNETAFWSEWQGSNNHRVINVDRREIICAITFRIQIQKAYRWPVRADSMFFLRFTDRQCISFSSTLFSSIIFLEFFLSLLFIYLFFTLFEVFSVYFQEAGIVMNHSGSEVLKACHWYYKWTINYLDCFHRFLCYIRRSN